ncbi:MAG: AMP-binding protein [Alphaproteobacteria bacterium]|nr:AMP-binding protein [Alphaproteobacteria bacterium]
MSLTLPGKLAELAARHPERVAIREKRLGIWQERSWADYWRAVQIAGRALEALGVTPGDAVAILSDNRPEWIFADLGAQLVGARAVGIYQTNPAPDVAYIVNHSQAKVLVVEDQEQLDKALEIREETPGVEVVLLIDPKGSRGVDDPRLRHWAELMAEGERLLTPSWATETLAARDPAAPSMVVYTSGTTGPPKGALISARNAMGFTAELTPMLGVTADDTVLSYLPLCHVAEKIFTLFLPLNSGATVHFGESIATVQADLQEVSPSVFLGVPRIWEKMHASVTLKMKDSSWLKRTLFTYFSALGQRVMDPDRRGGLTLLERAQWFIGDLTVYRPLQERLGLRNCRIPVTGAAPISPELIRWFWGVGIPLVEGYGQTECAGVSHIMPPTAVRVGTVGIPVPGTEQRIAEDGEILVRGAHVFVGYLHNAEATAETVDPEGWLHTGDVGEIDDQGYLRITGRKKEILITAGGKNLSPEKIENALKLSPYIKEAVAIGDARKFVSALIQIDADAMGDLATRAGVAYTDFADLAAQEFVLKRVSEEVRAANEVLAHVEQVKAFRLLPKELHQDDGELTATQKVRRREVLRIWSPLVEDIYGGRT